MVSRPPLGHRVARVDRQVEQHLLDLRRVDAHAPELRRQSDERELDVLADDARAAASLIERTTSLSASTRRLVRLPAAEDAAAAPVSVAARGAERWMCAAASRAVVAGAELARSSSSQ